jgi:hypothetical protein
MHSIAPASAPPVSLAAELKSHGVTDAGIKFIAKAIHPPGPTAPASLPDASSVSSTYPEYRETHTVTYPHDGPWDCLIVKAPGNVHALYVTTAPAGTDFRAVSFPRPADVDVTAIPAQPSVPAVSGAMSGLTLQNPVEPAPDVLFQTLVPEGAPTLWRKTASSITAHMTSSDLYNQGTVYSTQVGRAPTFGSPDFSARVAVGGERDLFRHRLAAVPVHEDDMAAVDPKLRVDVARNGTYLPLKYFGTGEWVGPDRTKGEVFASRNVAANQVYMANGPSSHLITRPSPIAQQLGIVHSADQLNWEHIYPIASAEVDAAYTAEDTGFDDWATGVILFRGLAKEASLTLVIHDVVEQVPQSTSVYRPFVKPPVLLDTDAMRIYAMLAQRTPNAYPASFNSWGSIWKVVREVAKDVWPVVKVAAPAAVAALSDGAIKPAATTAALNAVESTVNAIDHATTKSGRKKPARR